VPVPLPVRLQVVMATVELMRVAFESDPAVLRFAWLTESCLPVRPLHETMAQLLATDMTWMDTWNRPRTGR
jgi:hypothetical protein